MADLSSWLDIDPDIIAGAQDAVRAGGLVLLAVSGRLAAGKDTVAERTMRACAPGAVATVRFGDGVVAEVRRVVDQLLDLRAAEVPPPAAAAACAAAGDFPADTVRALVDLLWEPLAVQGAAVVSGRTAVARHAFQTWGAGRRAEDPEVWVRRGITAALRAAGSGCSVVIPDVRTRMEADAVRSAGFLLVRVEASAEIRGRRLTARDGLRLQPETAEHPTETELDDYDRFHVRVVNDDRPGAADEAAATIAELVRRRVGVTR